MFLTCVTSSCRTMDRAVKSMEMVEATGRRFHVENSNLGYALLIYGCPGINVMRDEYSESDDDRCDYFSDEGDESDDGENEEEENEEENEEDSESENDADMSLEGVVFDGDDLDDPESDNDHDEVNDDMDDELQEGQEGEDTSDDDNTD